MFASKSENFLQEQWVQSLGFLASFGVRRFPKGERKVLWCACRRIPLLGYDAPTPAREQGLQPYGAFTLFFRWRKKSVQKKASGTATPGKSPLLPILAAGLAMSRAAELASYACYRARSELAFFRRQNGRAFFPPLPIAALLPRSRRGAYAPLASWDASV